MKNMNKNSVKYLQNICFLSISFAEESEIKKLDCHTPDLVISQASSSRNQIYSRIFISSSILRIGHVSIRKKNYFPFCVYCLGVM